MGGSSPRRSMISAHTRSSRYVSALGIAHEGSSLSGVTCGEPWRCHHASGPGRGQPSGSADCGRPTALRSQACDRNRGCAEMANKATKTGILSCCCRTHSWVTLPYCPRALHSELISHAQRLTATAISGRRSSPICTAGPAMLALSRTSLFALKIGAATL
jgi:hypothetical protein